VSHLEMATVETSTRFFTVVARNYLPQACALGDSVRAHHPDATYTVLVLDDATEEHRPLLERRGFAYLGAAAVGVPDLERFLFRYSIVEASTAIKPFVIRHLFGAGAERVVYLDPDILCYRRLRELEAALDSSAIVLTPHATSPHDERFFPDDHAHLESGVYNLGFVAVRRSPAAEHMVDWWCDHLLHDCRVSFEEALFVDQKWMDLVPAYFDDVLILKHHGYNMAYWNIHERSLRKGDAGWMVEPSGVPLTFFHFSGFIRGSTDRIAKYQTPFPIDDRPEKLQYGFDDRQDLRELFQQYEALLGAEDQACYSNIPYAYDVYDNGERISVLERALYRRSDWSNRPEDPFRTGTGTFWESCRRAGLRPGNGAAMPRQKVLQQYDLAFRAIQLALRGALVVLGTDTYGQLAKYLRRQLLLENHKFLLG
jgi:hypothetical protein